MIINPQGKKIVEIIRAIAKVVIEATDPKKPKEPRKEHK